MIFSAVLVRAATTIGTNITTDGALTVSGLSTFGNVSTTLLSATNGLLVGSSGATSIFGSATSTFGGGVSLTTGNLNLPAGGVFLINNASILNSTTLGSSVVSSSLTSVGTLDSLTVSGQLIVSSFGQGWIYSSGGTTALTASTSPTVNYITATSTTATSTFAGDLIPKGRLVIPMGELNYFNTTGATITIASASDGSTNLVKVAPVTALSADLFEFDNGGANDGRLRYTGATTKMFHTAFTISMDASSGSGTNLYLFGIAKNGAVSDCKVIQSIAVSNDTQSTALHCIVSLATNDYLELYAGNLTDGDDLIVKTMNLFAMGL